MMPSYSYDGVTFAGRPVSGVAKASDRESLGARLQESGVLLLEASPRSSTAKLGGMITRHRFASNVTRYFRHLATLIGAGVPLSKALDGLSQRAHSGVWRQIAQEVADTVRRGSSLSEALAAHKHVFSGIAIPMIAAGESGGNLAEILERIADHREKAESLTRKIRGALVYPAVVSVVAVLVVWIILAHVVPVFVQMFANLGAELPAPTKMLITLSDLVRSWWLAAVLIGVVGVAALQLVRLNPTWKLRLSRLVLRIPLLGGILGKIAVARVSRTVSTLINNGVTLLTALEIGARTAGNTAMERIFVDVCEAVKLGRPVSEPLSNLRSIPPLAGQILSTGEETANMGRMFGKLADFYENETDAAVGIITSVLEPGLVVIMGVIVAGILIAMYMPMFDVLGQIGG